MAKKYAEIQEKMNETSNFEEFGKLLEKGYHPNEFGKLLENGYHSKGHTYIGKACSNIYDVGEDTGYGVMTFSEVSGRDPIFYRWHTHIEEIVQQFRDSNMPP